MESQETFGGRKRLAAGNVWWQETFIKFVGFKGNVNVNSRKLRLKSGMSDSHKVPCKHCLNWIFMFHFFKADFFKLGFQKKLVHYYYRNII